MRGSRTLCLYLVVMTALCLAQSQESNNGVGIPRDWSRSHLAVNTSAAAAPHRDPRVLLTLAERAASRPGHVVQPSKDRPQHRRFIPDWAFALGGGGLNAAMSPAKFNFSVSSTVTSANCSSDYVVYPLNASGNVLATISTVTRTSNVVTVTTSSSHNFRLGYAVSIAGVSDSTFNGSFTISSVPSSTTFAYAQTAANAGSSGGTATMAQANLVGLNNLYTGSAPANNNGICGSGGASISATAGSVRRLSNAVFVTTATAHNFVVGNWVTITGVPDTSFNGSFQIAAVTNSTTFVYSQTGPNATSQTGTAAATAGLDWAYNTTTVSCGAANCAGSGNFTSPVISFDSTGSKIAFVESTSDPNATCPGRPGTGACSVFHVLKWTAGEGIISSPLVPGQGASTASMVSITYASASNTTSSPWIDYANDVAYVAADDGNLYRILGVFNGTPTLDTGFTMSVTGSAVRLSPPIQLAGTIPGPPVTSFNLVFIGDGNGQLWAIDALHRTVLGTTATPGTPAAIVVGGNTVGTFTPGTLDPGIAYYDSVGDPRHVSVFATSSSSANSTHAGLSGKAAVVQGLVELNTAAPFATFDDVGGIALGQGATSTVNINLHAGAFDNTFYTTPTSGFSYFCGTQSASTLPALYRIGFNQPLAAPRNLVPVLNSGALASTSIASTGSNIECSPLTEFANPNLTVTDLLFFGITGTTGGNQAMNWNITGALQSTPVATASEAGGTSGMVVDNAQAFSGNGSSQGSSIYFGTLNSGSQCGANTYCAVKLRQSDLN